MCCFTSVSSRTATTGTKKVDVLDIADFGPFVNKLYWCGLTAKHNNSGELFSDLWWFDCGLTRETGCGHFPF